MSRVAIVTVGSRGDVQPFIALARALAGEDVCIATHEPFRHLVESNGVDFRSVHGDPKAVVDSGEGQELLNTGRHPIRLARRFAELLRPHWNLFVEEITPLVRESDVVVYSPLAFPAAHIAEASGIPAILAAFQPLAATGRMGPVALGGRSLGPLNRPAHRAVEVATWMLVRSLVNEWRSSRLGLDPAPILGPFRALERSPVPQLYAFSRYLCPRPEDWPEQFVVTGSWLFAAAADPPRDLADWLDAGQRPIYAGFGSMSSPNGASLLGTVVDGVRHADGRIVLPRGSVSAATLEAAGDALFEVDDVDHAWLFARCAAVVHHGGAGTTVTAAAAGVPMIVVPFFADQPFWAYRAEIAGGSVGTLDRRELSTSAVATLVSAAQQPPAIDRAANLGRLVRAERGAERAAHVVRSHLAGVGTHRRRPAGGA